MRRVLSSWLTSVGLLAPDQAEFMARMRAMEQRIRALEAEINVLKRKPKLAGAATMPAPNGNKRDGNAIAGEIISLAGNRFEMNTQLGMIKVTFAVDTKFECAAETAKGLLRNGEQVKVFGRKLASGDVVAQEIFIGASKEPKP